jgi:transposase-like protein
MTMSSNPYRGIRFPPEGIQVSLRDVELILAAWDRRQLREHPRVGSALRPDLRQYAEAAPATPGDKWSMGEVFVRIRGKQQLFGACDQDGNVVDILALMSVVNGRSSSDPSPEVGRLLIR